MIFCASEVPSLALDGNRQVENGNYLPISTTDLEMCITYTGLVLNTYN